MKTQRAHRLPLNYQIRYRLATGANWYSGTVENFSGSGLLFTGDKRIAPNLVLVLPSMTGSQDRETLFLKPRWFARISRWIRANLVGSPSRSWTAG